MQINKQEAKREMSQAIYAMMPKELIAAQEDIAITLAMKLAETALDALVGYLPAQTDLKRIASSISDTELYQELKSWGR